MNNIFVKLLKYPYWIVTIILIISVLFTMKMKENSRMETDLDEYMPQDHPAFVYSNKAEEWFNIKDGIIIAIENKNTVFNNETLQIITNLTKRLQKLPQIQKKDVTSLYTADNIIGAEEGMDVKAFYENTPSTPEELNELKAKVKSNEMVFERLVSQDETVSIIIAAIDDNMFSQEFYSEILAIARESETKNVKIYVAGRPIIEGSMALLGPADMKRMVPIVLLVIIIVLFLTLRSFQNTILTLSVVTLSTIWAFGLMALLNIPIYAVSTMIPVMLIAIGVADGIHLFNHLQFYMNKNPLSTKQEALSDMIHKMWKPVVMTSVTTAVGFISLLTSQIYPIKYFGLFTAFGVMVAMVFSLVLIPVGIMIFKLPKPKPIKIKNEGNDFAYSITEKILKHKNVSIFATIIIIILSIVGINKVWINSSFLDKFEKDSEIVLTDAFINTQFGGTSTLNLILDSKDENAFKKPEILRMVLSMQKNIVDSLQIAGNSFSLTDYVTRMNKVMHADNEEYNTIPDEQDLIAQYLLLYEMSGDPENLAKVVNYNYNKLNVNFQLKSDNSKTINAVIAQIETYKDDFEKLGVTMKYAGSGYKGLVFTDLVLQGQIMSLIFSLLIVIVLLGITFKNITIGFIGAAPIIVTAAISFGIMGWANIALNSTTALLSSIAIGVGVDFAIHFIEQYKFHAQNSTKLLAAQKTMATSGRALIFNAAIVVSGFMVLVFSVFPPNRELGALVSLNMLVSFIATLSIMLVLLNKSNIFFTKAK